MPLGAPTQIMPTHSGLVQRHGPVAAAARHSRSSLAAHCREWMRKSNAARSCREIEPRMARDIGVAVGRDRHPAGFAVDPRPLWGIGLVPQPTALPLHDRLWP